jgi:hypothetical protein
LEPNQGEKRPHTVDMGLIRDFIEVYKIPAIFFKILILVLGRFVSTQKTNEEEEILFFKKIYFIPR